MSAAERYKLLGEMFWWIVEYFWIAARLQRRNEAVRQHSEGSDAAVLIRCWSAAGQTNLMINLVCASIRKTRCCTYITCCSLAHNMHIHHLLLLCYDALRKTIRGTHCCQQCFSQVVIFMKNEQRNDCHRLIAASTDATNYYLQELNITGVSL